MSDILLKPEESKTEEERSYKIWQQTPGSNLGVIRRELVAKAQLAKAEPIIRKQVLEEVESWFSAMNYLSPEAGREPVHSIDVYAWERLKRGEE